MIISLLLMVLTISSGNVFAQPAPKQPEDGAAMLLVPAGEFWMGADDEDPDEAPRHRVHLGAFYIDRYEVTNAEYGRFLKTTGRQTPRYWADPFLNGSTQPVVGISWHDASTYCTWASKRLPTEAEWEKAARGLDGRTYPWGEEWDALRANNLDPGAGQTRPVGIAGARPVGSHPSGASPYGAHDMAGNVAEWVADWYAHDYYTRRVGANPRGPKTGETRVLRGGSFANNASALRTSARAQQRPDSAYRTIGVRCARDHR